MADAQRVPKRSIYSTLVIPMIALVVSEVFLFSGILFGSGVLQRLDQNDRDILVQQVITRRDSLQSYLVGTVGDLRGVANVLNAEAQRQLDEGTIDFDLLDSDPVESNELVNVAMEPLISTIRDKRVSGAFIVFNTHDLSPLSSTGEFGKKPGVHIHDMDPAATPSARNEDLVLECASTEIVQSFRIATGTDWLPTFNFQKLQPPLSHDAFYLPWQTAYESSDPKEATDFAYWGVVPFSEHGGEQCAMSYSIPLILEDGTVYGVVGVELSADYLEDLLPSSELLRDVGASYVLAIVDDSLQGGDEGSLVNALPVVQSSRQPVEGVSFGTAMELAPLSGNDYTYKSDKGDYYSGCQFLRLYNTNSPFEHQHWLLVGMVSESVPHSFGNHVRDLIVFASLLMAVLGIAGSILAARSISRPIRGLSADVASAQLKNAEMPKLEETGISEVDQLTGAITSLSKDIASVRQLEQQRIEHERDYDLLTGLMNRRALYREANRLFASPADVKHAALVMLDLDDLKTLNDTYGHDWGDKYIYQAARCFEDAVPSTAMVVRVSGDEFFILLYGYESREEIENVLNQMREGIASHAVLLPNGDEMPLRASGGVAFYPDDAVEFTELTKLADFAMYQVKVAGKNNIGFFDLGSYQEQNTVRRALDELDELLGDSEKVDYHFQPIFDLSSGDVFAYEALMRVSLACLRSPADVVGLARQEGRMVEVERMTWERAFACYSALRERNEVADGAYLFVNSFANVTLPLDEFAALSSAYPDVMSRTVIEITEAENMDEDATAVKRAIPRFNGFLPLTTTAAATIPKLCCSI